MTIPSKQTAVQLIGPEKLRLNTEKQVVAPGEHQILCKVEAVGLCFSDLKLLKQFSKHARKTKILSGIEDDVLKQIPSYVPGEEPTVPGHEAVVTIASVGDGVKNFQCGQRYLVQTDYRWLRTESSNGSFGYNFEGALQEYVLLDERVFIAPNGDSMMIPVSEQLSASAIALVEPWACVEDAYASAERRSLKTGGQMLVVCEQAAAIDSLLENYGKPAQITWLGQANGAEKMTVPIAKINDLTKAKDHSFDDVVYFGSDPLMAEKLFDKVGPKGLLNLVLCGGKFGKDVVTQVGRVHYGGIRIIGTTGSDPCDSMKYIPPTDEIREGDRINVVGAGGPMGVMHVIRNICQGVKNIKIFAGDMDQNRLQALTKNAAPLAKKNQIEYYPYDPSKQKIDDGFDYIDIMVPIPALVAASVKQAQAGGLINIFAGIPAAVSADIDLDSYIEKQLYFIGTSGSVLEDMKLVYEKVASGNLDTNVSVAAVCGLADAPEGIKAVENRTIAGKIIVYPTCKGLPLTTLEQMEEKIPEVAKFLDNGLWTKQAQDQLLKMYSN